MGVCMLFWESDYLQCIERLNLVHCCIYYVFRQANVEERVCLSCDGGVLGGAREAAEGSLHQCGCRLPGSVRVFHPGHQHPHLWGHQGHGLLATVREGGREGREELISHFSSHRAAVREGFAPYKSPRPPPPPPPLCLSCLAIVLYL